MSGDNCRAGPTALSMRRERDSTETQCGDIALEGTSQTVAIWRRLEGDCEATKEEQQPKAVEKVLGQSNSEINLDLKLLLFTLKSYLTSSFARGVPFAVTGPGFGGPFHGVATNPARVLDAPGAEADLIPAQPAIRDRRAVTAGFERT
jgi:hypothetical protein